ncbi:MAG: hypothetical protein WBJ17_00725 [Natronincolaceae bacterium]
MKILAWNVLNKQGYGTFVIMPENEDISTGCTEQARVWYICG